MSEWATDCAHYFADPSGGFGWPTCVKCGAPASLEEDRWEIRACCQTKTNEDHVPTCASLDARQRRRGQAPR